MCKFTTFRDRKGYAHTIHIAHIIADGGCDQVWHRKLRWKGDSGQFIVEGPKKLVKNWLNIDTWPGCLPFRTVESIPGRLPGALHSSHENDYLGAYHVVGVCPGHYGNSSNYYCIMLIINF